MPSGLKFGIVLGGVGAAIFWRVPLEMIELTIYFAMAFLVLLLAYKVYSTMVQHKDHELDVFGASEKGREAYRRQVQKHNKATRGKPRRPSLTVVNSKGGPGRFRNA